ncbi:hypothetical protein ACHAXS_010227, partial [Conticribra weissflogii]
RTTTNRPATRQKSTKSVGRKIGKSRANSGRSTRSTNKSSQETHNDSDDDDDDDDDGASSIEREGRTTRNRSTRNGAGRPSRKCVSKTQERMHKIVVDEMKTVKEALGDVLEEDDKALMEGEDSGSDDKRSKNSASDDSVSDQNEGRPKRKAAIGLKHNKYDDDEDYSEGDDGLNSDGSDDDDDMDENDLDDDDELFRNSRCRRTTRSTRDRTKRSYQEADEEEFGTADESSSDEKTAPSLITSPQRKISRGMSHRSPWARATALNVNCSDDSDSNEQDRTKATKRKNSSSINKSKKRKVGSDRENEYSDDGDANENCSDDNEIIGTPKRKLAKSKTTTAHSPSAAIVASMSCPSTHDGITMMKLPKNKPHICYISPDGGTRHCFTIDTLYRIAISRKDNHDTNFSAGTQKLQFLQPPHFRSPMEDDLIDQIASRFGRSALIIEKSNIYKKLTRRGWTSNIDPGDFEDEMDDFDDDGEYVGGMGGDGNHHGLNFDERFQNYLKNLMGNTDLYCCPLCYIEADRRLGNHGDEEMEADDDSDEEGDDTAVDRFSFIDDPLTILESLDSTFKTASSFCFRLLSGVKSHLKNVHGVQISEISGNDLFKRFQVSLPVDLSLLIITCIE